MTRTLSLLGAALLAVAAAGAQQQPPPPLPGPPPVPQQPTEIVTTIAGDAGAPPRYAVPDFIALSKDAETVEAAKTLAAVLFDDLNFEREVALIPKDVYATVPAATSMLDVPFDRWRELNADGLVIGTVRRTDVGIAVEVRLFHVQTGQSPFGKEYTGAAPTARRIAHFVADEIHDQQFTLRGVARTKLTFNSDRDGERMASTVENRGAKEIYIADYDGANQRRVTTGRELNIASVWAPDARTIAYSSWRRGPGNIFLAHIYEGLPPQQLTKSSGESWLPSWSPDGTRIAFTSTRDGNAEIYVMNRDGSNVRRLTNNAANDSTPTWSPTGNQIAFTSSRGGDPTIYTMGADGLDQRRLTSGYADRPTWSPAPFNEIAYSARTGPGFDIMIMDLASRTVRQVTHGEGSNESPAFAPNGRHVAFASTRAGKEQIFTIARDGRGLRQLTRVGNNRMPDWSRQ